MKNPRTSGAASARAMVARLRCHATAETRGRIVVFAQAGVIMAAILGCVWELHHHVTSRWIHETPPSLAFACLMLQAILAVGGVVLSGTFKKREERHNRRSQRIQPVIRERLAVYCLAQTPPRSKGNDLTRLKQNHSDDFEICLLEFLNSAAGHSRERLSRLVTWLGLVEEWKRGASGSECRRTRSLDFLSLLCDDTGRPALLELIRHGPARVQAPAVAALTRLSASKGAAGSSAEPLSPRQLTRLFREIVSAPRLTRAMLAGELRGYASELAWHGIPEILQSPDLSMLLAALELIESWHCGLPLAELARLVHHSDSRVRTSAMRLAPLTSAQVSVPGASLAPLLLLGLHDADARVKMAALHAAAQLQIHAALPLMERCAESSDIPVAALACSALAAMGPAGRAILQGKIAGRNAALAARATESLAAAQLNVRTSHAAVGLAS